jgi:pyridoxal phosphate enzyme (YggS family)
LVGSVPPTASNNDVEDQRTAELVAGLAAVEARIAAGCLAAGRARSEVTLIVVTKTYPADDVRRLAGLGVREVGESRDQEAAPKAAESADLDLAWHFIGRLQSNKARSVAQYAHAVHSVDRSSLVAPLGRGAVEAGRTVRCFVQVSLDGDPARGGVPVDGVAELADRIAGTTGLELAGVMAVAPNQTDPDPAFALLKTVSTRLIGTHPQATAISAGMSGDLEEALRHGATHLRVGSAVLGVRPPLE